MSTIEQKLKEEALKVKRQKKEKQERDAEYKANAGKFQKVDWFKPKEGDNRIRFMPHWKKPGEELFYKHVAVHFNIPIDKTDGSGKIHVPVRCLEEFGEECPVCDMFATMSKEEKKANGKIRRQEKTLYNIYSITEKKLYTYSAPATIHMEVFALTEDMGGDFSSMEKGINWKLVKEVDPGKSPMLGTSYKIRPALELTKFPPKLREYEISVYDADTQTTSKKTVPILEALTDLDRIYEEKHVDALYFVAGKTPPKKSDDADKKNSNKEEENNSKLDPDWDANDETDVPDDWGKNDEAESSNAADNADDWDAEETAPESSDKSNSNDTKVEESGIAEELGDENDELAKELKDLGLE